jgi:hypothetical protein
MFRTTAPSSAGECLRHREGRVVVSPLTKTSPLEDKRDATWIVRPGLAERSGVSLESKNFPGGYLRHQYGAVYQQQNDGTEQFALDATFVPVAGKNGQGVSFVSVNYPSCCLRHYAGQLFLAAEGGSEPWESAQSWADDVSWAPIPPWRL